MWKTFWPKVESLFLTKPFGAGAGSSDPTTPDVFRRNRDASVIPGIWNELFVRINGQQQYLWRALDQDGDVIDILRRSHRDQRAAERFLRRLLRGQGKQPFRIITDKLKSYAAASRTILPGVTNDTQQSGRDFASAHSDERTRNASIQFPGKLSAFCRSMVSSGIYFALRDIPRWTPKTGHRWTPEKRPTG